MSLDIIGIQVQSSQVMFDSLICVSLVEIGLREFIEVFFFKRKSLGQDSEVLSLFAGVGVNACQECFKPVEVIFDEPVFVLNGLDEAPFGILSIPSKKLNLSKL